MPILYTASQVASGNLPVRPVNLSTNIAFEILNYSPYFLLLGTTESGAESQTDPHFITILEPWEGLRMSVPPSTTMTTLYIGAATKLSQNDMAFGSVTNLPGVSYVLYNTVVAPTRWRLISQGVTSLPLSAMITDVGFGFTRLHGGGTIYCSNSGIAPVTFSQTAQQVVVFNQGNANVSFWGDEDADSVTTPADAIVLVPGGSFSLAWQTLHLYFSTTGTQVPVQVQGWGAQNA